MAEENSSPLPNAFSGLFRRGPEPYQSGTAITRQEFGAILEKFSIIEDEKQRDLMYALISADSAYKDLAQRITQKVPNSELKLTLQQIRNASAKLQKALSQLDPKSPKATALRYHFEKAAWKLGSDPRLRESHPLKSQNYEDDGVSYGIPSIEQAISLVTYLERVSEIARSDLDLGSPGRKENSAIKRMILPIELYWTTELGKEATADKSRPEAITAFEQFLDACTRSIAPGRWNEIKSAFTHR